MALRVRADCFEHGACRLLVNANSTDFAGCAEGWFSVAAVQEFAEKLRAYPLPAPVSVATGVGTGATFVETVVISIYPIGPTGRLGVHVRLASVGGGRPQSQERASLEFETEYEALGRFAAALAEVVHANLPEATL